MLRQMALFGLVICLSPGCGERGPGGSRSSPAPPDATPSALDPELPSAKPLESPPAPSTPPLDRAAIRAAERACADCHPEVVEAWRESPMGRSMGPVERAEGLPPTAAIVHPATGEVFSVAEGRVFAEVGGHRARATHVIGSGEHTRSFVHRFAVDGGGERAELMPLTWYRETGGWGLSPGYRVPDHPGFHRSMNLECLTCHNDPAATTPGDDTRFVEPFAEGIGCARCHGDGRAHVEARLAGRASPMVMPDRLPPDLGADVCGQCHLQGAVRLLRAGRRWDETQPGQPLGDVIAVFARQTPGADIGIASHAERLRRSRCVAGDPEAGRCTTCHTPHPTGPRPDRSAACRDCHAAPGGPGPCAGPVADDCAGCHMARTATHDIPHVAMTDHFIRRAPAAPQPLSDSGPLVWVNRPEGVTDAVARRLEGRAYAEAARAGPSTTDRQRALELLESALAEAPDDPRAWADLASMKTLSGDPTGARAAIEQALARAEATARPAPAAWWASAARLALQAGSIADAATRLARARALRPGHPEDALLGAQLAAAVGDGATAEAALAAFEGARPGQGDGRLVAGALALAALDPDAAHRAFTAAASREPGDPRAWLNLCRLEADRHRWAAAGDACDRATTLARGADAMARVAGARARVALGRGDARAAAELAAGAMSAAPADASFVLGRLAAESDRLDDALALLDRAVRLEPTLADAWAALSEVLRRRGDTALADRARAQARRLGAP